MVKCHVGDSDCQYSSNNTEHLHQDYADVHKIVIENVKMAYPNSVEFQKWKYDLKEQSNCRFVTHHGRNSKYEYYYCHRSGLFTNSSTVERNLKTQGSNIFDSYCPAKISIKIQPVVPDSHYQARNTQVQKIVFLKRFL